jgi:quercetin dioxygenase-like cupin family protein
MSELFDAVPCPASGRLLRASERTVLEAVPGMRDQVLSLDPAKQLDVILIEMAPGANADGEAETHGTQTEFVLVLEGTLNVQLGETSYEMHADDALTFSGDVPHRIANLGATTTRIMWVSTPGAF